MSAATGAARSECKKCGRRYSVPSVEIRNSDVILLGKLFRKQLDELRCACGEALGVQPGVTVILGEEMLACPTLAQSGPGTGGTQATQALKVFNTLDELRAELAERLILKVERYTQAALHVGNFLRTGWRELTPAFRFRARNLFCVVPYSTRAAYETAKTLNLIATNTDQIS
jgi:hypothetical protein